MTLIGTSLPEFVWGNLLIIIFAFWLQWLPPSSLLDAGDSMFAHFKLLILPVLTLTLVMLAYTSRMTRTSMIDVMERNFIRTARLKGIGERKVIFRHALPNALLPVITISGVLLGFVLGGSVAVEQAFGVPGLGRALVTAVIERDIIVVQNLVLLYAVIFVLVNVLVDLSYAWLDPRIRYS